MQISSHWRARTLEENFTFNHLVRLFSIQLLFCQLKKMQDKHSARKTRVQCSTETKKHFTELLICLILMNLPFLFFDQSEAEKIPKKRKVNSWTICAMETTDNQKILCSLSRCSFRWRNDWQYQTFHFSSSFMLQCQFVFHMEGHWFPCFKSKKISLDDNLTHQSEFSVWTKHSFSVIERDKKIHYYDLAVGFFCPDWVLFDLTNREQVHFFMRNSSFNSLVFRPIRIRKKLNLISRVFEHWKRRTSEHWCWENYFPIEQIPLSMEKRSRRFHFSSLLIISVKFPFVFIFSR